MNPSWFSHGDTDREGAVEMLTKVISNMTSSLIKLNLYHNNYSSVSFEKLVTKIAELGDSSTLLMLDLQASANFESDESVRKFAEILAIVPYLIYCDIMFQNGNRKVKVEV